MKPSRLYVGVIIFSRDEDSHAPFKRVYLSVLLAWTPSRTDLKGLNVNISSSASI